MNRSKTFLIGTGLRQKRAATEFSHNAHHNGPFNYP